MTNVDSFEALRPRCKKALAFLLRLLQIGATHRVRTDDLNLGKRYSSTMLCTSLFPRAPLFAWRKRRMTDVDGVEA